MLMPSLAWLSCTIGTTWPICSVPVTGSLSPKTPLSPEESPPVLAWQPIQLSLPKPELVSWPEVAKSLFSLSQKMNKWFSWRKRTLVLRWLSPGLGHFALSWAHSIWRASLELLRWWREHTTAHLFAATPDSTGTQSHPKLRKLGTRILLPPALLSKQQDSPQLPQWIVNPFRTTQAHQTRSVLFT